MSPIISPPTVLERAFRTFAYMCIACIAVWVMFFAPHPQSSYLLPILTWIWSAFLACALPASIAAALGRYRWEYLLLPWFGGAIGLANLNEWIITFSSDIHRLPGTLLVTIVGLELAIRFIQLGRLMALLGKGPKWSRRGGPS